MKTIFALAAMVAVIFAAGAYAQGCGGGYGPPPQPQPADAYLHSIYDLYVGPHAKGLDSSEATIRKYFQADLAQMIVADDAAARKSGEIPTLEGDPFVDAQEWNIKSFDIHVDHETPDAADATIKFTNEGSAKKIRVLLIRTNGRWMIHDIIWNGDEGTLRELFSHH